MAKAREEGGGGGEAARFRVDPDSLTPLAQMLDDLEGDAREAKAYATAHADIETSGGSVMTRLADLTFSVKGDLEEVFERLTEIGGRAGDEIIATRNLYRSLDAEAARRLDAEYWSR